MKHNLPLELTPFVGRQAELTEVARLLQDAAVRLLTLLGPGGMGKTRLALEAGLNLLNSADSQTFVQGVYFVGLAPLGAVDAIVPAVAAAVGFSFREGGLPEQQLLDYLAEKSLLLILDNFEHLLGGANLVPEILQAAPRVKILCTTRTRLEIPGEQLFQLEGLDFPAWETPADALAYSALKLFLQSARRVRPGFELAAEDLKYVARICKVVGGMPLGILLAAAWVEMLSPREIADEMMRSLDFLESGQQSIPERQRSMRAVFDYTWKSLTAGEQRVFAAVSVFRGGFTREAAQEVSGASLRELMGLVNKSLLHRAPSGRYEIHELLRQFGAEQLGRDPVEETEAKDRHCALYAGFLHDREGLIIGKYQKHILDEIELELENVQAGWDWAVARARIKDISSSMETLALFCQFRGSYLRGAQACGQAVQMLVEVQKKTNDPIAKLAMGKMMLWRTRFSKWLGLDENPYIRFQESLAIFRELGNRSNEALSLCYLGGCFDSGFDEAKEYCLSGLAIYKELADKKGMAYAFMILGDIVSVNEDDYVTAMQYYQDSLALAKEVEDMRGITMPLLGIGSIYRRMGDYQAAIRYHQEALELNKTLGDQYFIARVMEELAVDRMGLEQYEEAEHLLHQSLNLLRDIGDKITISDVLGDLGYSANHSGKYEQAVQFARESLSVLNHIQGTVEAGSLMVLGEAYIGLGNLRQARNSIRLSLLAARVEHWNFALLNKLVGIARLRSIEGDLAGAIALLALVIHHPASFQMTRDQAALLLAKLEAELPPDAAAQARERGVAMDLDTTMKKLIDELGE